MNPNDRELWRMRALQVSSLDPNTESYKTDAEAFLRDGPDAMRSLLATMDKLLVIVDQWSEDPNAGPTPAKLRSVINNPHEPVIDTQGRWIWP